MEVEPKKPEDVPDPNLEVRENLIRMFKEKDLELNGYLNYSPVTNKYYWATHAMKMCYVVATSINGVLNVENEGLSDIKRGLGMG